nr:hypothetical protein BaRGS_034486 [Batillaria attramentaria]
MMLMYSRDGKGQEKGKAEPWTGGQFYLNDVYAEKDPPAKYKDNETLWCMGTTGAMRWDTLAATAVKAGFTVPYLTQVAPINIAKEEYNTMLGETGTQCKRKGVGVDVDSALATILSASYLSDSFAFADASGSPTTKRNQNPFALIDKLKAEGRMPDSIYKVE